MPGGLSSLPGKIHHTIPPRLNRPIHMKHLRLIPTWYTIGVLVLCILPRLLSAATLANPAVYCPEPYSDLIRDGFARRYAMQPYIYTEARKTYDTGLAFLHPLYYEWPEGPAAWSPDSLLGAMQTGDRLTYDPSTTFAELSALEQKLSALPGVIQALRATDSSPEFAKTGSDSNPNQPNARLAAYNSAITTAMAHLADISETKPRASLDKLPGEQSTVPDR
jgi:hypothetical protein